MLSEPKGDGGAHEFIPFRARVCKAYAKRALRREAHPTR